MTDDSPAVAAAKRLLAISAKKMERAEKLRADADNLDEEATDLTVAAWALDPSTDPRPVVAERWKVREPGER